jgi:hypothetical protein
MLYLLALRLFDMRLARFHNVLTRFPGRFLPETSADLLGKVSPLTTITPPIMAMRPPMIWINVNVSCSKRMANTVVKRGIVCSIAAEAHAGRR